MRGVVATMPLYELLGRDSSSNIYIYHICIFVLESYVTRFHDDDITLKNFLFHTILVGDLHNISKFEVVGVVVGWLIILTCLPLGSIGQLLACIELPLLLVGFLE